MTKTLIVSICVSALSFLGVLFGGLGVESNALAGSKATSDYQSNWYYEYEEDCEYEENEEYECEEYRCYYGAQDGSTDSLRKSPRTHQGWTTR